MNEKQFYRWLDDFAQPMPASPFQKPLIMGILNVTDDSFSDGGTYLSTDRACEHAFHLVSQGVDILDIGGESTKPGAIKVPLETELSRVIPVIEKIRAHSDICISIDTYKPLVMRAAIDAGANIINHVYALRQDDALATAAELNVPVCLMHMQGEPQNMQHAPDYPDGIMAALITFFNERMEACNHAGIDKKKLILDPGFGFGKLVAHNLQLIYFLSELKKYKSPIMIGASRKSTIGAVLEQDVKSRMIGGLSIAVFASLQGANIIRTHDPKETHEALKMVEAIISAGEDYNLKMNIRDSNLGYDK